MSELMGNLLQWLPPRPTETVQALVKARGRVVIITDETVYCAVEEFSEAGFYVYRLAAIR